MIRESLFVAALAVVLSVLLHLFLLLPAARDSAEPATAGSQPDTVALGNAFEDLAETATPPEPPTPAEEPEPDVEQPTEPDRAEIPVSETLVASSDPQKVNSPDIGQTNPVQPDQPVPEIVEPADSVEGDRQAADEVDETPPVQAETQSAAAPEAPVEPIEDPVSEPEQLAALPAPSPIPDPSVPAEEQQPVESDTEDGVSDLAVATSIRPRLPDRTPAAAPVPDQRASRLDSFDNLRFPNKQIDSPLTTYRRQGVDAFTRGGNSNQSGGRGPGNSNVTNYAGQVLVHLNRTPPVYVSVRGFAKVFFEINPDGTLAWVDIIDSSGSTEVDRAAKEQVRRASPFPKPPGGVSRKLSFYFQNG
ncbi:energy transducer TonB [Ruegeria arenilitoris]|uniref:energy transducer TonB n=1 Tax=Ruegeria arenilitoris TaxID=1173585 RepID=UPI00147A7A31|nr:energy transducer TonB [Ruegeria arenilitoris]